MENFNPWRRKRPYNIDEYKRTFHSSRGMFDDGITSANIDLDVESKRAALKASKFVVSLVSKLGNKKMFAGSGTLISSEECNNTFFTTIITSASLLRKSPRANEIPDDIKVKVYLSDGQCYKGEVIAYDFHYNIATVRIKSSLRLPIANLRLIDDSIYVDPSNVNTSVLSRSFSLRPHSTIFKLSPGDNVLALGRYYKEPYELMVAPGIFSADCCNLDCTELFNANCKISKTGIGGPLLNCLGEVIGMNFYQGYTTPFLPSNIVYKCLDHFKKIGRLCPPWLGLEMTNLYSTNVANLEAIVRMFPDIYGGVLVEQVIPGSPAESAGIQPGDVIIKCGEKVVRSFLEFFEEMWDKAGELIELVVIRESCTAQLNLSMVVGDATARNPNRWPLPKKCWIRVHPEIHVPSFHSSR